MASARGGGVPASNVSARSSTSSIRRCRSPRQTSKARSGCIVAAIRRKRLQDALLQDLDLLLRVLQRRLAERDELGAALVRGERLLQRQLAAFHRRDDRFELGERGLEIQWDVRRCGHAGQRLLTTTIQR